MLCQIVPLQFLIKAQFTIEVIKMIGQKASLAVLALIYGADAIRVKDDQDSVTSLNENIVEALSSEPTIENKEEIKT